MNGNFFLDYMNFNRTEFMYAQQDECKIGVINIAIYVIYL